MGLPARLVEFALERHPTQPGAATGRIRRKDQPAGAGTDLVLGRGGGGQLPAGIQALDQAGQAVGAPGNLRQQATLFVGERQTVGQPGQGLQVQPVGPQAAPARLLGSRRLPGERQVAAGPALTVGGLELQGLSLELKALAQSLADEATGDRVQGQRGAAGDQHRIHLPKVDLGLATQEATTVEVSPGPQPALAAAQVYPQVGIGAQTGQIDRTEIGVELALPVLPAAGVLGQQGRAQLPHQGEGTAPVGGRAGVEPQVMAARAIAGDKSNVGQDQGRGAALLVDPAQGAPEDHDLFLPKEPVGRRAGLTRGGGDLQPGHPEPAGRVATHLQLRPLDIKLLHAQVQQGAGRERHHDPLQPQGIARLSVLQDHLGQLEGGHERVAVGGDRTDAHGHPQNPRGLPLQRRTEIVDTRHNPAVQRAPGQGQRQPKGHEQPPKG